jgi:FkbM family methyltransferase
MGFIKMTIDFFLKLMPLKIRVRLLNAIQSRLEALNPKLKQSSKLPKRDMFNHIMLLKEINFEPGFILDIGAYRGQWSKQVRQIYPNVKMVMFEAQESKTEELIKIKMEVEPCELFITLLGSETRENVVFYEMETGSSIYEENTNYERTIRHKKMKKLDDFDLKFDLFSGGFLKLDVQGSEIDVIRGAKKIIERTDVVLMEMNLLNYNEGAPALNVVIQELDNLGFSVFDICDEHRTHQGILFQIDVIFMRTDSEIRKKLMFKK